ncbi:PAB1-binding protein PBP1, interacts with poly(A)-binding protein [Geosmithia morbida]|uniref:PAB1-binding protein PBP1, interacts with poly(A)-binding protein n=1 Tax=Geosmithia morbida TaxID=1094350 RepID=A0A9P4YXR5_9HYPO|nr:PAB1-binding protein PBP1, interacts with poly(A)-binding protein [Geosmithia morbida]KAF4123628.1 PAB1-binding protein PBP1, interacts with poly(A)-binding protein [Geosmithia morbida]
MPPVGKRDNAAGGGNGGRVQNGNRPGFRTDSAISNSRQGGERVLQRWMPDANDAVDDSLESPNSGRGWDQFAENERLFGLQTDYDESFYTTAINKNHPQYRERIAAADRKAREITCSVAATAHVAEERVMDYVAGQGTEENEEDKYSGVRRQDFPPLGGQESKYTPPAMRAPSSQATVKGAPVDPAIISSQIKAPGKKPSTTEDTQTRNAETSKDGASQQAGNENKPADATVTASTTADARPADKVGVPTSKTNSSSRNLSPQVKEGAPSATSTVERDVLKSFKSFASQQRENAQKVRSSKAKADKEVKLTELKKFASSFKLSTPVPTDLVSIIAKDPNKQKEIQAKAIKNAEDVAKAKEEPVQKDKAPAPKDAQAKPAEQSTAKDTPDARVPRGPTAGQVGPQGGPGNRHPGHRQQFPQQQYQGYRNNRGSVPPHVPGAQQQGGNTLAQRIRNGDQQKYGQSQPGPQNAAAQDVRAPPTGPANAVDSGFSRRSSAMSSSHLEAKLNPNSHEFKPSPFAASFNPGGRPSAGSSPRSAVNHVSEAANGPLIRRKTKAIDVKKCYILGHLQTITPPQGRNWDENGGLRPSFDTLPTWRQLQDDEKPESTMHLTYKEYFDRQPFAVSAMVTPNPPHVVPQMAHHHQLPFHLQPQMGGPRQSPHMGHMQMHTPQHGGIPQQPYGHDDHRMVHSNSAQSFASPRLGQATMAYPGPGQMPYQQPVFMGPGTPQMGQFRSFPNNPQYMGPQQGQMGGPMMMQPHFLPGPQSMVGGPQMMYPGAHMAMGGPPQPGPGVNGYPSPGRPAAPMMAHQGSQQGQPMYGMSPSVQYSQPVYVGPGQPQQQQQPGGPMPPRGYNVGPQHPGANSQHQGGKLHGSQNQQHRGGANGYGRRGQGHGQGQGQQHEHGRQGNSSQRSQAGAGQNRTAAAAAAAAATTTAAAEGSDEAK